MKRSVLGASLLFAAAVLAFAEGAKTSVGLELEGDYQPPNHEGVDASGLVPIVFGTQTGPGGREVGSSWGAGEVKAILSESLVLPALSGKSSLTSGNNLSLQAAEEFSPVSLNANFSAVLTPVAFLRLGAGAGLGTGWDIGFVGMGLNNAGTIEAQNFGGVIYRAWIEGTLQFDLAAVVPGEWNHIVALANPRIQYQGYSGASNDQAWIWEADDAMNFNGLKLTGNYLLGYQMPLAFDLVALLLQTEGWIGDVASRSTMNSGGWGSDYTYLTFGPLFDFKINGASSIAVLPQFKTGIQWTSGTQYHLDFQTRSYQSTYVYFYRLAFDYTLKI